MRFYLTVVCLVVFVLSGCGGGATYVPVSGQVVIDGEPVEGCSVSFSPVTGELTDEDAPFPSAAKTGKDGRYTLKVIGEDIDGAAVGKHQVRLSTSFDTDQIDPRTGQLKGERVPEQYREGFEFEVPEGGTDKADFKFEGIKPR